MDLSKGILSIRKSKNLNQLDVADALGMERSNYARLEKRGNKITFEQAEAIAKAMKSSLWEVLKASSDENEFPIVPEEDTKQLNFLKEQLDFYKEKATFLQQRLLALDDIRILGELNPAEVLELPRMDEKQFIQLRKKLDRAIKKTMNKLGRPIEEFDTYKQEMDAEWDEFEEIFKTYDKIKKQKGNS